MPLTAGAYDFFLWLRSNMGFVQDAGGRRRGAVPCGTMTPWRAMEPSRRGAMEGRGDRARPRSGQTYRSGLSTWLRSNMGAYLGRSLS